VTETGTLDPPRPRIETEPVAAARLDPGLPATLEPRPGRQSSTLPLLAGGASVLVLGLALLGTLTFVLDQFARSPVLGGLTAAVAAVGFGLLGVGIWRELRGLLGLSAVDRLRVELAGSGTLRERHALRAWLRHTNASKALISAAANMEDVAALRALLRAGPVAELRAQSEALGRAAAVQIFAATAAMPAPAFDGLLVAWRGVRLVRQVAELHGLRPGLLATLALLRRTALSAAGVMATDMAANTLAHAVVSNPLLQHLAGDVAGAGVAARRMIVLARAAAAACSPIEPG